MMEHLLPERLVLRLKVWARLLTAAVACPVAIACSSSTAPADPFVGQWKVAVASTLAGDSLVPDSFVVGITRAQGAYHVTFPDLTVVISSYHLGLADTAASSGFAGHGDSMSIALGVDGVRCYLSLTGAAHGGSAGGSVIAQAAACALGTDTVGTWSAVKQ
jgi:hypothetical protein